jgi:hypothetical protein
MNLEKNVDRKEKFDQVCVWQACSLGKHTPEDFEKHMKENFKADIQFLEEIETCPDTKNGEIVPDTGGRHDLIFAVHNKDIGHFAIPRLMYGIKWIEDVLAKGNYRCPIYPERVFDYCTWNKEHLSNSPEAEENED